jgi:hypothetical protein
VLVALEIAVPGAPRFGTSISEFSRGCRAYFNLVLKPMKKHDARRIDFAPRMLADFNSNQYTQISAPGIGIYSTCLAERTRNLFCQSDALGSVSE